jgi:hypothetical protein
MLTLDVCSGFYEDALGQLRCGRRSGFFGLGRFLFRLRRLSRVFLAEGFGGDIVDRAGSALHLEATTFQER